MSWINFKAVREQLNFEEVLKLYNVELKNRKGDQHHGFCPLPQHNGHGRSASFSANLKRGIFQCFGCGAKGNVLDFVLLMDGLNPSNGRDVRTTALKLQRQFNLTGIEQQDNSQSQPSRPPPQRRAGVVQKPAAKQSATPVVINEPLDFELKGLDPNHPYLLNRGFTEATIQHFGLGYCARGSFAGRACIPLHDAAGQLIGYAGRIVDDSKINEQNPKYKLPSSRLRNDVVHEFRKSLFLYSGHRIGKPVRDLLVVEGYSSTWWLWQHGYANTVALMGDSCSAEQAELIVQQVLPSGCVWVMPDGNKAGDQCAASVLTQVSPKRFCRWIKLEEKLQPTDYTSEELWALVGSMQEGNEA